MPTPIRRRRARPLPDESNGRPHVTQGMEPGDLADDVLHLLNTLGEDASRVEIAMEDESHPGEFGYLTSVTADEFRERGMEMLKQEWGGGRYRLQISDRKQGAIPPIFIRIDRRFRGKQWLAPSAPEVQQQPNRDDMLLRFLITQASRPAPQPQTFGLQEVVAIIGAIGALRGSGGGDVGSAMAMMREAMAFAREINPPERDLAQTAIESFAPALTEIAAGWRREPAPVAVSHAAGSTRTLPVSPAPPPPPHTPPHTPPPPAETSTVPTFQHYKAQYLPVLLNAAASDSDPALYAEMIADQLDANGLLDRAYALCKNPDGLRSQARLLLPELWQPQVAAWSEQCFSELVTQVRAAVEGEPETAPERDPVASVPSVPALQPEPNGTKPAKAAKRGKRTLEVPDHG